ncbi:hypothetical protein FGG08_003210 [Glutinoglossum americanum]|uniref:THUMP domain-containing protein n=1 Tax=Glutinoglossum americanum TaxID=1670608 RepID=A0A9P8IA46_9PEZI|nr:hypothetical protein FGG08_003210 [Glutinoglossum americanum]
MTDTKKRKLEGAPGRPSKKVKGKRQWQTPKQRSGGNNSSSNGIEPGDSGIWATCDMHKEAKCTGDLIDLFNKQAEELYGSYEGEVESGDIEGEINREISEIRQPKDDRLFSPVRVDVKCVLFFKTREPIEPVGFVHRICTDASSSSGRKQSRWVKRLTPMTLIGKATENGLDEVSKIVLAPHFHRSDQAGKKFAIRTNIRNHNTLTRDSIIKRVAAVIGPGHRVDLKDYDLLVLVEIFQNICGMSVVPADFDQLRRYNLAEINDASRNLSNQQADGRRLPGGSGVGENAADEVDQRTPSIVSS